MVRTLRVCCAILLVVLTSSPRAARGQSPPARFGSESLRLVLSDPGTAGAVTVVREETENALRFYSALYGWKPSEKIQVLIHDRADYGEVSTSVAPRATISLEIAPPRREVGPSPAGLRIPYLVDLAVADLAVGDKAAPADRVFRALFFGKVRPDPEDPVTLLFGYLTAPRSYVPNWLRAGFADYLSAWRGGAAAAQWHPYNEMVFRASVRDGVPLERPSRLTGSAQMRTGFQALSPQTYGARFLGYLALRHGHEQLVALFDRSTGSGSLPAKHFHSVYGVSLGQAWDEWVAWETKWQRDNLALVRSGDATSYRTLSAESFVSISSPVVDTSAGRVLLAVRKPGWEDQFLTIDLRSGALQKVARLHRTADPSLVDAALDPERRQVFYTTDHAGHRSLAVLELDTVRTRILMPAARLGDLTFDPRNRVLWAVRHEGGTSSLVRVHDPYVATEPVFDLPPGADLFDIRISPDGRLVAGTLEEPTGERRLVAYLTDDLERGRFDPRILFDFGHGTARDFVFSADGQSLYGTSSFSGVSNIFRVDIASGSVQPLSNAETGFFKPVPLAGDSLLAFRFTPRGFQPVMLHERVADQVSPIRFLHDEIAREDPVVRGWERAIRAPSDSARLELAPYRPVVGLGLESVVPIIEGYKSTAAFGFRMDLSDPAELIRIALKASVSPPAGLEDDERLHLGLRLRVAAWELTAVHNQAGFYDLFGPVKIGRRGSTAGLGREGVVTIAPLGDVRYAARLTGHRGIETIPEYQNVRASSDRLLSLWLRLSYSDLHRTFGADEDEWGISSELQLRTNVSDAGVFPRAYASAGWGSPLPLAHSSLWIRGALGSALTSNRSDSFARFYFGGFGNNWVDYRDVKRFRDVEGFPGIGINEIGGASFVRGQLEWALPPARFRMERRPGARLRSVASSLFATGLVTDLGNGRTRRGILGAGAQVDLGLVLFSDWQSTVTIGYGLAMTGNRRPGGEILASFRVQ